MLRRESEGAKQRSEEIEEYLKKDIMVIACCKEKKGFRR